MSTTIRMARMVGPAIVGLMSAFIPMIHFFSIDAVTFIISALCVLSLRKHIPADAQSEEHISFSDALMSGFKAVQKIPGLTYVFISKGVTTGAWNLALMIGFPLLVHQMTNGDARSFGLVMASYGVGNFAGALYFGNRPRPRSEFLMYAGYLWLGLGFMAIGAAPTIPLVMLAAAVGGFSGPMNDLGFIDMMQAKFPVKDITKIFRLRMAVESAATLVCTLVSPWIIHVTSVRTMIIGCGVAWIISGALGFVLMPSKVPESQIDALK
jgi:hypothetical protein